MDILVEDMEIEVFNCVERNLGNVKGIKMVSEVS